MENSSQRWEDESDLFFFLELGYSHRQANTTFLLLVLLLVATWGFYLFAIGLLQPPIGISGH